MHAITAKLISCVTKDPVRADDLFLFGSAARLDSGTSISSKYEES